MAASSAVALATCSPVEQPGSAEQALSNALQRLGFTALPSEITWIDPPSVFGTGRAVVRARHDDDLADILLVRARRTARGAVLGTPSVYNLSSTPNADEDAPSVRDTRVAFVVRSGPQSLGVRTIDLQGEAELTGPGWSLLARAQNAITNVQQTGQASGVNQGFWAIEPPAEAPVSVSIAGDGKLDLAIAGNTARLDPQQGGCEGNCEALEWRASAKARPGNLVTWAVDRVRALPWFGDERMQMLKAVAFDIFDVFRRTQTTVMGDNTAEEVAADLGDVATRNPPTTYTDPETGWPPPPVPVFLKNPMEGEGQWILLENDPFMQVNPNVPPAFATTFVRTDRERSYTRIYITAWDPRQVELHVMAGSVEPKGATGEAGPGLIPRRPELMKRLVAAVNGGFQAMHGEWGTMSDGVIYLPPKPYAATVAEMRDGNTAFGTWPLDPTVPAEVLSYRQNLTPLVVDGKINPYKRGWWGGTPPEWEDRVHSTRTGMCLTQEGFVAYFYGNEIDMLPLAQAMVQARCSYGLHLDMNPGHTGLEFYRVGPKDSFPALGRPLDRKWEAEGPVPQMEGWTFRARRMVRFMGLMNFPRYIQREARDYMYLTLRPVLPGLDLQPVVEPALADEGKWRVKGLPQHGFPYAIATTQIRPDAARASAKVLLLKIDPRMVQIDDGTKQNDQPVVVTLANANASAGAPTLWMTRGAFTIDTQAPGESWQPVVSGAAADSKPASVLAAVGLQDQDGMLVYAEVQDDRRPEIDADLLTKALQQAGCSSVLLLQAPLLPVFGNEPAVTDAQGRPFGRQVRLLRGKAPGAQRFFSDTPVVDPKEWAPLQAKRIRYFKKRDQP